MNLLTFLIIGIVSGWLAGKIVSGRSHGLVVDLVVGIIGAFIGGLFAPVLFGQLYGFWGAVLVSTFGAIVLLAVIRLFGGGPALRKRPAATPIDEGANII